MPDLLGAHMSIAGGLARALERGLEVGCSVVQIFLRNQRQWTARPYSDSEVREFRAAWKASGIRVVFAHANYLINLATPVAAEWRRAVDTFHDELERAEALGLPFVVIHPGSHRETGLEEGVRRVARAIDALHERTRGYRERVVLENTAGGGSTIGRSRGAAADLDSVGESPRGIA
jgi:deoxyribonuclease-4